MPDRRHDEQPARSSRYPVAVLVRCTEEERGAIHANAVRAGRSASRYLAELGALAPGAQLRAALTPTQAAALGQLSYQLRRVGVNLNQLAHRENAADYGTADPPTDEEVEQATRELRAVLARVAEALT